MIADQHDLSFIRIEISSLLLAVIIALMIDKVK